MAAPIDRITGAIQAAFRGAIADSAAELNTAASSARTDVQTAMQGTFGGGFGIARLLEVIPGLGSAAALLAGPLGDTLGSAGKWVEGIAAGWALGEFFSEALRPVWLEITHSINAAIQSEVFDPQTAATLESKGIIGNAFGRSEAAGGNLAGDHYDKLVEAARDRPDAGSVLDMLNRGEITNADALAALQHHGYPPDWSAHLLSLRRQLLGGADLALAKLRGNIDQAFVDTYSQQLGLNAADMQLLIDNTGEPPGPQELMEAVRRGFIDDTRFHHGILQSRVRDEWIDVLDKLRFHPMSVGDAVRAVVQNHLTQDEGLQRALQNGLEQQEFATLVESAGRPLSHEQMLQLFHRGQATREQVDQALRESDIKNKYKDQAFELGRRLIPERTIVSMVNHGAISRAAGVTMLEHLGFDSADIDSLIALGVSERKSTHKALSRSDIVSMYSDKLIRRIAARDELIKLGYDEADATELLDLSDFKAKASRVRVTQRGVEASLKAHHLEPQAAVDELVKEGMDTSQAQELVDVWLQQREKPTKSLTQAQILKAGVEKLIPPLNVFSRLVAEGLVPEDANLLMRLHGIDVTAVA